MADLSSQLQPASYRGVPFHVNGAGIEAGRRTQLHEYPKRDRPWAEDLGRATRVFTVEAFVLGQDYIQQANALITAAEEEGPGTLVHPWLGSMQVTLKDLLRVSFDAALGQAAVTFAFTEPGDLELPSAEASTAATSQLAADDLSAASATDFASTFNILDRPAYVAELASAQLAKAFDFASDLGASFAPLSSWAAQLGGYATAAQQLLTLPGQLADQVVDWFDLSGIVASLSLGSALAGPSYAAATAAPTGAEFDPLAAMALGLVGLAGNGGAGGVLNAPLPVLGTTAARQQAVINTAATNALVRRALLAQAVGISSQINTTEQAPAYAVRNALCRALDAESLVADDTAYNALQAARQAVWADITARASGGARIITITPTTVLPALVLAYDRYENAARADELVSRNKLNHPGFVPQRALQVLSV